MRGWSNIAIVALVAVGLLLAGCTSKNETKSGGPGETTVAPPAKFADGTGAIEGVVLDESQLGIQGVSVGLQSADTGEVVAETESDSSGLYTFSDLEPKTYRLSFLKLGYESESKSIEVLADQVNDAGTATLVAIEVAVPYQDNQDDTGRMFLSVGWSVEGCPIDPFFTCQAFSFYHPDQTQRPNYPTQHHWNVTDTKENPVETIVGELKWPAQSAACLSTFNFDVIAPGISDDQIGGGVPSNYKGQFKSDRHQSPITIRIDRALMIERGLINATSGESKISSSEGMSWHTRVFAQQGGVTNNPTADVGCSFEQPFEVFFTVFYGKPAPPEFTRTAE